MSNDWFTEGKNETNKEYVDQGEYQNDSGWGDNNNNGTNNINNNNTDNVSEWADEGDNASCWQDNADRETISEWLVDEEGEDKVEMVQEGVKRNTFYEVCKLNINSIFDGPKLFHQEHVNKKKEEM